MCPCRLRYTSATIKIEGYGDDITTGNPLSFTNQEFIASYADDH